MNRLGAVGEYFAFESFLDWFYATVTGDSYSQAISKIVERTNYNKGVKCFPVQTSKKDCFEYHSCIFSLALLVLHLLQAGKRLWRLEDPDLNLGII